jgi:hypothetical protein
MKLRKTYKVILEFLKWAVVFWLLYPISNAMNERVDFTRVASGILLFVIFSGKMLYDRVLTPWRSQVERSNLKDVASLFGIIVIVALLIGIVILFVGLMIFNMMKENFE